MELPYISEERLQKMGIPMGPRMRILQEAQVAATACSQPDSSFSVYIVWFCESGRNDMKCSFIHKEVWPSKEVALSPST